MTHPKAKTYASSFSLLKRPPRPPTPPAFFSPLQPPLGPATSHRHRIPSRPAAATLVRNMFDSFAPSS
ncbi:hypothetical protein GWI33_005031 [Rhynchophorus ferrugineus]|uniref:Uncharacterized protein n=1 Tax=Rhynchophorus ferrugineus TaxID=354439 RepID=A0A834IM82_RHYFE|nr:hypothetical protein GWI33_005031 [Rhynchophorus ferrugineus]